MLASNRGHHFISGFQNLSNLKTFLRIKNTRQPIITSKAKNSNELIAMGYKKPKNDKALCVPAIPSTITSNISIFTNMNPAYTKMCNIPDTGSPNIFDWPIATFNTRPHLFFLLSLMSMSFPSLIFLDIFLTFQTKKAIAPAHNKINNILFIIFLLF